MEFSAGYSGDIKSAEIFLSADFRVLNKLGVRIRSMENDLSIDVSNNSTKQFYQKEISCLKISKGETQKLSIELLNDVLVISGGKEALIRLAETLEECFENENGDGYHIHFDYLDGFGLLEKTAHSLVIEQEY